MTLDKLLGARGFYPEPTPLPPGTIPVTRPPQVPLCHHLGVTNTWANPWEQLSTTSPPPSPPSWRIIPLSWRIIPVLLSGKVKAAQMRGLNPPAQGFSGATGAT